MFVVKKMLTWLFFFEILIYFQNELSGISSDVLGSCLDDDFRKILEVVYCVTVLSILTYYYSDFNKLLIKYGTVKPFMVNFYVFICSLNLWMLIISLVADNIISWDVNTDVTRHAIRWSKSFNIFMPSLSSLSCSQSSSVGRFYNHLVRALMLEVHHNCFLPFKL